MGSSASKLEPQVAISRQHPLVTHAVDIDYTSVARTNMVLTCSSLGEKFYVRVPPSLTGSIVFYNGPTENSQVLMIMLNVSLVTGKFAVKLPASLDENRGPLCHFIYESIGFRDRYLFDLDVGRGPNRRVERFEWRRTHGAEVEKLNVRHKGWKLVMLPQAKKHLGDVQYEGYASDGGEVVAVMGYRHGWLQLGRFSMYGPAAHGELGEAFKLMALASYMTAEYHERRERRRRN